MNIKVKLKSLTITYNHIMHLLISGEHVSAVLTAAVVPVLQSLAPAPDDPLQLAPGPDLPDWQCVQCGGCSSGEVHYCLLPIHSGMMSQFYCQNFLSTNHLNLSKNLNYIQVKRVKQGKLKGYHI